MKALIPLLLLTSTALAAPPRREPEPPGRTPPLRPLDLRDARESSDRRRPSEPSPPGPTLPLDEAEVPLHLDLRPSAAEPGFEMCKAVSWKRVRARLESLENSSQYMSLEVWGDVEEYGPFQTVLFHLRSPRGAYVTLYWLGPDGYITVPLENVHIPGERNVTVDTGGIIVPPYGREQWVAIATLEPFPLGCSGEAAMLANLERRLKVTHGVGRWEVRSVPGHEGPRPPP